jgi:hypothetical protein
MNKELGSFEDLSSLFLKQGYLEKGKLQLSDRETVE